MRVPAAGYFFFRFLDPQGRTHTRLERLPTPDPLAARLLIEHRFNATVLTLWELPEVLHPLLQLFELLLQRRLPLGLLAEFLHNLGMMLQSGLPIDLALADLAEESQHRGLRQMTRDLEQAVRSGNSLASGLEWHARLVPETVRSLVAIGEQSGHLDRVLVDSADHLNRIVVLRQGALKTMIYPAFVVLSILGAALFWVYYVLPDLADIFRNMGAHLPPLTLAVMAWVESVRELLSVAGGWILLGLVVGLLLVARLPAMRHAFYTLAYHLPISRTLVRTSALAFIAEYLALLSASGINLLDCMTILEGAVNNSVYRKRIQQVRAGIGRGNSLSSELAKARVFPPMMVRLVAVGEQSGTLDRQLKILAADYSRKLNHVVGTLAEIMKPAVLLLAGGLFIFVVVVFLLPVYDLIAQSTRPG